MLTQQIVYHWDKNAQTSANTHVSLLSGEEHSVTVEGLLFLGASTS